MTCSSSSCDSASSRLCVQKWLSPRNDLRGAENPEHLPDCSATAEAWSYPVPEPALGAKHCLCMGSVKWQTSPWPVVSHGSDRIRLDLLLHCPGMASSRGTRARKGLGPQAWRWQTSPGRRGCRVAHKEQRLQGQSRQQLWANGIDSPDSSLPFRVPGRK